MGKHEENEGPPAGDGTILDRLVGTEEGKARARKLFAHAQKAEDTRNYDYAIELYVNGLATWPDAIDEGLRKLRVVGTARKLAGGKPASFMAKRKRPTNTKDPAVNLNNALYLFGLSPSELACMESILRLAAKARCDAVAQWISPVLADAYNSGKKLSASHYDTACSSMDAAAELAMQYRNDAGASEILRANIATAEIWVRHYPNSNDAMKARADATGKLAIVRGKYDRSDNFTGSLKDADRQHELHDRDKRMHAADRAKQLIDNARAEWEANPGVSQKLFTLVDLMTRSDSEELNNEAIKLLKKEHASSGNYVYKQKADEIAMRVLGRRRRAILAKIKAEPERPELRKRLKAHDAKQIEFETQIYEERARQYPTDLRLKYELAKRLFMAARFDDAIPLFQQAQADARVRGECRLLLGRSFYKKKFYDQAVDVLRRGIEELGSNSSELARELNYWLARALEMSGNSDEAKKAYGQLIQMDYNFRDARQRLEGLVSEGKN